MADDKKSDLPRDKVYTRWGQLKTERATWWAHYKELSTYLLPRTGRFFVQDRDRGNRRHNSIYDSTATKSVKTLAAGMLSGMTSPARPWLKLRTNDKELNEYQPVQAWLADTAELMLRVFAKSNTYRALHSGYQELGVYGTFASVVMPDFRDVIRHYPQTCGQYCIAQNFRGEIDTLYREFQKPVAAVVKEFGYANCSKTVQNLYDRGTLDAWVTLMHAIEPRADRDHTKKDGLNMAWRSVYFELAGDKEKVLQEGGFKSFPAIVPRWEVNGEDIYGESPGMLALGDVKQLQHQQLAKAKGIDYKVNPPLQVPSGMKNRDVERLPGGISYYDGANGARITTMFDVNLDLNHLLADIQDVRQRIKGAFFEDLFLLLANSTDVQKTATEVAELHEEKMLMLGPVLERLQNEELSPLINMTFNRMVETGMLPKPPPELHLQQLEIEYDSILMQAQRAIGMNSTDRYVARIGQIAQFKPEVLDNFDADEYARSAADMLGVNPHLIVANDKVAIIREQRAQQQAQAQQAALMQAQSQTAKNLAQSPTGGGNVLSDLMGY